MVNSWTNDGLTKFYGTSRTTPTTAGEYRHDGPLHMIEVKIDLTALATGAAVLANTTELPAGMRIEEIEIVADTAATSSGSAVLNIGLIRQDRTTELDYDGFVAALAKTAYDAAGEKTVIRVGSTGAGALLGTTLAYAGLLTADYDTAAFTAGTIYVRIRYYKP